MIYSLFLLVSFHTYARAIYITSDAVVRASFRLAVDNGDFVAVFDAFGESHVSLRFWLKNRRILCQNCVVRASSLNFIKENGSPTWIRTMNNASKGRCVTITPSDCRGRK